MPITPRLFLLVFLASILLATSSRADLDSKKELRSLSHLEGESAGHAIDGENARSGAIDPVSRKPTQTEPVVPLARPTLSVRPLGSGMAGDAQSPEQEVISTLVGLIQKQVRAQHASDGVARRDAHAKHHGCVQAHFTVLDEDHLPQNVRRGVFQPGARYPALIRFSNGSGSVRPDGKGDGRGMAVKLLGVSGPKLHPSEHGTQDFLMINHPVFFIKNTADYLDLMSSPVGFVLNGWPWNWRLKAFWIMLSIAFKSPSDVLDMQYYSMVPYRLGREQNMKYSAKPCAQRDKGYPTDSDNFLRENMTTALSAEPACFDFMVQLQVPGMPIDDATVLWEEKASPFIPVAKILIKPQSFSSPEQMTSCENLSYTPWHSVPEHEPLGPVNAARLAVYEAISGLRHELNSAPRAEP